MEDKICLNQSPSPSTSPFHDISKTSPSDQRSKEDFRGGGGGRGGDPTTTTASSSVASSPFSSPLPRATPYTRCQRVQKTASRLLCVCVALVQGVAMDAFLAEAFGDDQFFYLFVVLDLLVAAVIAVTMVTNFKLIAAIKAGDIKWKRDELPLSNGNGKWGRQ